MKKFWSQITGKMHLVAELLLEFLNESGFYNYRISDQNTPILIKREGNVVWPVTADDIKRALWEYVERYAFTDVNEKSLVLEQLYSFPITTQKLAVLKFIEPLTFMEDKKDRVFICFKNGPLVIEKDGVYQDIGNLPYHIWRSQILNFHYEVWDNNPEPEGHFFDFLRNISRDIITGELSEENLNSLRSIIGYMLVTHKDRACNPAIILRDIPQNGNPEGSTGKGILHNALAKIRETVVEDGKIQDPDTRFVFCRVRPNTKIFIFDDVRENFPFERLFSAITEDLIVEEKNVSKYCIPFEKSPKVLITSNYPIKGEGRSHDRRRFEFILSDYFNNIRTPKSVYGRTFFDEWEYMDWLDFYKTIFDCIRYYLNNGLVPQKLTIANYNYLTETSKEFRLYAGSKFIVGEKYNTREVHNEFKAVNPEHFLIEQNTFTKWVKLYAKSSDLELISSHSGKETYFQFTRKE